MFLNAREIPVIYVKDSAAAKWKYVDEVIKMYLVVKLCKMKHRLWSFNYS